MNNSLEEIRQFVIESNLIEGIIRDPTTEEINELIRFMKLPLITIEELQKFVCVYQPTAQLRDQLNMNVRVGLYYPPFGGPEVRQYLEELLSKSDELSAYALHVNYEMIHPFTDCNGRSGRALWAWKMKNIRGGFLMNFYHQTLQAASDIFKEEL